MVEVRVWVLLLWTRLMHSGCVVFDDGTIFKESVFQRFAEGCERFILLFCGRPGLDNINIERHWGHERRFSLPQFERSCDWPQWIVCSFLRRHPR